MPLTPLSNETGYSVTQIQQQIQKAMVPVNEHQKIPLSDGLQRVLAEDVIATIHVPAFDNSAMDGYAFAHHDLATHPMLSVVGKSYAGHPFSGRLQPGQAIQITTGAPMPEDADSVLPQEQAQLLNGTTLDMRAVAVRKGQHKRLRGEDLAAGATALTKGSRLGPAELGLLASLGLSAVTVFRRLRVAIFSTGDELRSSGQNLESGAVYDSNRTTLHAMLSRFGADVSDLGVLADDPAVIASALTKVVAQVDVIITSGGVSAGAADFTKQVLRQLGQIHFWSVDMRPGRPLAFGHIKNNQHSACVFGLPGNPVAMMVSFYFFVRPALQLMSGTQVSTTLPVKAILAQAVPKKVGRTEFQRGICSIDAQGDLRVAITGEQGSGMLSSMSRANCLVMLSPEQGNLDAGATVKILLFEGLV